MEVRKNAALMTDTPARKMTKEAMEKDFGWHRAADDYVDIYHGLHPEVIRYIRRRDK